MYVHNFYQPDFSCIFGKKYADAFLYSQVDTLVWSLFTDIEKSGQSKSLLNLKNNEGRPLFYTRKISIEDEKVELNCSNIQLALLQGMDLGRDYGITNLEVINAVKQEPKLFKAILSFDLSNNSNSSGELEELKKAEKEVDVVGIVIYPSFTKLELNNPNNKKLKQFLKYCKQKEIFIKIA